MALVISPIEVVEGEHTAPNLKDLTTNSLDGTGSFDVLMKAAKLHLQEEYNQNRITGKEYSQVYLGMLQAVLQQSITYLLNRQNEEKIIAEIGLVRQKTVTELVQTDDDIPLGLAFNGDSTVEGVIAANKALLAQQELLLVAQTETADKDVELTEQKIITELAQTDTDIPTGRGLNNSQVIDGLIKSQTDKSDAEGMLIEQKVVTEVAQINDALPTGIGVNGSLTVTGTVKAQIEKVNSEIVLLKQKSVTELAQTDDTIPAGTGISFNEDVTGVVGKQKGLFQKQTDGFDRDAEQKLTKILVDTWSVRRTTDEGTVADNVNKLDDVSIGAAVTKAKEGINIT